MRFLRSFVSAIFFVCATAAYAATPCDSVVEKVYRIESQYSKNKFSDDCKSRLKMLSIGKQMVSVLEEVGQCFRANYRSDNKAALDSYKASVAKQEEDFRKHCSRAKAEKPKNDECVARSSTKTVSKKNADDYDKLLVTIEKGCKNGVKFAYSITTKGFATKRFETKCIKSRSPGADTGVRTSSNKIATLQETQNYRECK